MYKLYAVPAELDGLASALPAIYDPQYVVDLLKGGLDPRCTRILVEEYYNDKDYRSTYYGYYAKKGFRYEPACVRLHFFDDQVTLGDGYDIRFGTDDPNNYHGYFGYMVLRPTRENTIGRSVLSASAINSFHGSIIAAKHKVHVLGHKLHVKGFPYMSQHTDISVCAHAACWAILRHYSERFPRYAECLTYDITRMAHEFDPGGLLPSNGLRLDHAERIFAKANTYPVLVLKGSHPGRFYQQLFAYVESGFPLFVEVRKIRHAVALIGHGEGREPAVAAPYHFASDMVDQYVVVDDNFLPYRLVSEKTTDAEDYGWEDFTAFIVPLPDKVYYSADAVSGLGELLIDADEKVFGFDHSAIAAPVIRTFLTTAAQFREFTRRSQSQLDPDLVAVVMQLKLPQFVWVVEIASQEQLKGGLVNTRAIIDATASPSELFPIFLMHDQTRAVFCDRGGDDQDYKQMTLVPPADAPLSRMAGDLSKH